MSLTRQFIVLLLLISFYSSAQMSRTHHLIDKNKGYLEIRIGKKYEMSIPESSIDGVEHKPGIVNYSYFYGIPIHTLKIEKDDRKKVRSIIIWFDHHGQLVHHDKNKALLLELLGTPSHLAHINENDSWEQAVWIGQKTTIFLEERIDDSLHPDQLKLVIKER